MRRTSLAVSRFPEGHHRRGAALLLVVIAVVISAMVVATLAQTAITQRRQMLREQRRAQAFWLMESGIDRALAHLNRDPQYRGEDWHVSAPGQPEPQPALVHIQIAAVPDQPQQRRVEVAAEFPAGDVHRVTLRRQLTWTSTNTN
jgi:Tfp pilus assembly protein PilX